MTDEELLEAAQKLRKRAKPGTDLWGLISDAEAAARGRRALLPRYAIEEQLRKELAKEGKKG